MKASKLCKIALHASTPSILVKNTTEMISYKAFLFSVTVFKVLST